MNLLLAIVVLVMLISPALAQKTKAEPVLNGCKGNLFDTTDQLESDKLVHFWVDLKTAIANSDKSRVARLTHYPLTVETPKGEFTIHSEQELIKKYERIFPAALRTFLLKQEPRCISRVGANGFSLGSGEIWFDEDKNDSVKLFTVNAIVYPGD